MNWKRVGIAAVAGALAGGAVWMVAKGELERDFGAGAENLEARLRASGATLTRETSTLCSAVARKAIDRRLAELGFTPQLLRDTSQTLDAINRLARYAESTGVRLSTLISRLT